MTIRILGGSYQFPQYTQRTGSCSEYDGLKDLTSDGLELTLTTRLYVDAGRPQDRRTRHPRGCGSHRQVPVDHCQRPSGYSQQECPPYRHGHPVAEGQDEQGYTRSMAGRQKACSLSEDDQKSHCEHDYWCNKGWIGYFSSTLGTHSSHRRPGFPIQDARSIRSLPHQLHHPK